MEVRIGNLCKQDGVIDVLKVNISSIDGNREETDGEKTDREPEDPAPIELQQKSQHNDRWGGFQMNRESQCQRGEEFILRVSEDAKEDQVKRDEIDLDES